MEPPFGLDLVLRSTDDRLNGRGGRRKMKVVGLKIHARKCVAKIFYLPCPLSLVHALEDADLL